ncbi:MAG TPA: polymer-forming cytoskeletal protein [Pyrinomonadaceae bacterium]|nr:polymer-forming cytoskeletal protein [Pyrinomonadaceae bacterium]
MPMSGQAVAKTEERARRINIPKDNWLGFIGDVTSFTGEVHFKSMLRIDGHFSGRVSSPAGTLIVSNGAQLTGAVVEVAVAKINGTVEGDIHASEELVLGPTANVSGVLNSPGLTVEEGAQLNAKCRRNVRTSRES